MQQMAEATEAWAAPQQVVGGPRAEACRYVEQLPRMLGRRLPLVGLAPVCAEFLAVLRGLVATRAQYGDNGGASQVRTQANNIEHSNGQRES